MSEEISQEAPEVTGKKEPAEDVVNQVPDATIETGRVDVEKKPLLTKDQVIVALAFGVAALAVVLRGITIPIPATPVVTDPREIFTTIGASLTGPIGGIIVGILAGIAEPGIPLASLLAHFAGGIFNGIAYKNAAWRYRDKKLVFIGLWALQVLVYYLIVVVPLFATGVMLFYPEPGFEFFTFLSELTVGVLPEIVFTIIFTSIIMLALPKRYKRPLW